MLLHGVTRVYASMYLRHGYTITRYQENSTNQPPRDPPHPYTPQSHLVPYASIYILIWTNKSVIF